MSLFFRIVLTVLVMGLSTQGFSQERDFCRRTDLFPSELLEIKRNKKSGFGNFQFKTHVNENKLNAYFYLPSKINPDSPVIFVMHGTKRNAESYLKHFAPIAERYNAVAVAPEFSKKYYPKSTHYTTGVAKAKPVSGGKYRSKQWQQPYEFLYNEIEHLFEGVKQKLNLEACGYYLYGHSAGGQFIHRMLTFAPNSRVIRAVAANSGWYTLPAKGDGKDKNYFMPYGLQGTPVDKRSMQKSFKHHLVVLVGENDTKTPDKDKYVRKTSQAMFQGENRYDRAMKYFAVAKQSAESLKTDFNWRIGVVPQANHSSRKMALSAAWYLIHGKQQQPCMSSQLDAAENLQITEILADPPKTLKGDANGDGHRDSQEDEFIELVNRGKTAICLSGWSIGDHDKPRRHVFPTGTIIKPGQALLVFGGGVPRGSFANSVVQWATFSKKLNLNNKGDGIFLHDNYGKLAKHISWGDCGKQSCAKEHIESNFDLGQSIVRHPKNPQRWVPHSTLSKHLYSAGTRPNGKAY